MKKPFFSIVIPTKDRADLVDSLIWSVLNQNFSDFEIIVCDNSVNYLTQEVMELYKDDRIINIKTGKLKMSENWNIGINAASGKYLMVISDKGFLKKGSLKYLQNLIFEKNYKCITWNLDTFIDPNIFITEPANVDSSEVLSVDLLKFMLGADYASFEDAPMHCTSCVSMEVIQEIKDRHQNVCQELNPDYTMASQILLNIESVYRINQNLVILRRASLEYSYGVGGSFIQKTDFCKDFINDHKDWYESNKIVSGFPIEGNYFSLDPMIKDVYRVLKDNQVDPDTFLDSEDRLTSYYKFTFKEILWRKRMGVNMEFELKLWVEAFKKESLETRNAIIQKKGSWRFISFKSNCIYFVKNNFIGQYLLSIYRYFKYKNYGEKYIDIKDFYNKNLVKM